MSIYVLIDDSLTAPTPRLIDLLLPGSVRIQERKRSEEIHSVPKENTLTGKR